METVAPGWCLQLPQGLPLQENEDEQKVDQSWEKEVMWASCHVLPSDLLWWWGPPLVGWGQSFLQAIAA